MWTIGTNQFCRYALYLLVLSQPLFAGCRGTGGLALKPREFVPEIPAFTNQERQDLWRQWGEANLRNGDLLFALGESRILLGLVNFSKLTTELSDSEFSHVAVVSRENGEFVVYDIMLDGPRRTPFGRFMADRRIWKIAVKRLQPGHRSCIPQAVEYCQQVYESDVPFDDDFLLNNEGLYCTEFIETAFRHGGLKLSEPIRIDQLPGFDEVPAATVHLVRTATSVDQEQKVVVPGNERIGIWSCPCLELILDVADASAPPEQMPIAGPRWRPADR